MRSSACAAILLAACARGSDTPIDSSRGATAASAVTAVPSTPPTGPGAWTVSETGWGPIRAGMSVADARASLGGQLPEPRSADCDHVRPAGISGVLLMTVGGQVARVEVSDSTVVTAAGARVGDTEARINQLYQGRVRTSPHKYVPSGRYLTVPGAAVPDSDYRLLFEIDSGRVTRYRSGRMPEVEWVEGCG